MDIWVRDINRYMHPALYAVLDLSDRQKEILQRKFARYLAKTYRSEIKKAIYEQTLADKWVPLNKAYKDHKIQTGLNPGTWIATSKLVESIVVTETPKGLLS